MKKSDYFLKNHEIHEKGDGFGVNLRGNPTISFSKHPCVAKYNHSHPFMDGNKRTGFQVADLLLRQDGIHIHANDEEILHALVKIAEYTCSVEKIKKWLREKVRPLHSC
ncbi:MAG: type II toxin-antitoxin system death-on-curing family toxin [ANME-2 cluster archaeon]|nr:type II toxin-antitoxin system death-on-curing family toxin [ANME-2 cluster archaeon]